MTTPNKALRDWLSLADPGEIRQVAKGAKTSVLQLRHIASGRRRASAALAQRIAHASEALHSILRLDQRELCEACGACPLAKR